MSEGKKDFWTLATVLAVVVLGWSFYINPDRLTKTRAFLGDTLSDSKTTAAVLSDSFCIRDARSSVLGGRETGKNWEQPMRQVLSEYHSVLMTVDGERTEEDRRRLANLGTKLDLMMNLNEEDQKRLWQVADDI
jgi:hypothetical protein